MIKANIIEAFLQQIEKYSQNPVCFVDVHGNVFSKQKREFYANLKNITKIMVEQKMEEFELTKEPKMEMDLQVIGQLVSLGGKHGGVLWVAGKKSEVKTIGNLIKMSFELYYSSALEQYQEGTEITKERLVQQLIHYHSDVEVELHSQFTYLNLSKMVPRVAILICPIQKEKIEDLKKMRLEFDTKEDIVSFQQDNCVLVFKQFLQNKENKISFIEYIHLYVEHVRDINKVDLCFFVGTITTGIKNYPESYMHALWLKERLEKKNHVYFSIHYLGEYFKSRIPFESYEVIFKDMLATTGLKKQEMERIIGALIEYNYNYVLSCKSLFIHRNTLVYKFDKIKQAFHIDPMKSKHDRDFLEYLYYYSKNQ